MVPAVCSYLCLAVFHIFFDFYSPHFQYVLPNLVFQLQLQWCLLQDKVQSSPSFLNLRVHIMPFFLWSSVFWITFFFCLLSLSGGRSENFCPMSKRSHISMYVEASHVFASTDGDQNIHCACVMLHNLSIIPYLMNLLLCLISNMHVSWVEKWLSGFSYSPSV